MKPAEVDATTGARAVLGSQRIRSRLGGGSELSLLLRAVLLRAEDGSRSVPVGNPWSFGCCPLAFGLRISELLLVSAFYFLLSPSAFSQARYQSRYTEPQWLTFHLSEISAGVYSEGVYENDTYKKNDTTVTHQNIFVGPFLGFSADGSIYHPNFLRYYINSEGSYGWNEDRVSSTTTTSSRGEFEYLGRFSMSLELLEDKPYHANFFANYDHTFRDNDFFNRVTVDSWRYGARAAWHFGLFNLNAEYFHRKEESTSPYYDDEVTATTTYFRGVPVVSYSTNQVRFDQKTISDEDNVTFGARHERPFGGTALNYNFNQYTRSEGTAIGQGTDHSISAGDSERFGRQERNHFNANASYYHRDTTEELSDQITAYANLGLEHRPNLSSSYDVNYDHFDTGSFRSDDYLASASLQHQLYESLSSSLTIRGSDYENSDGVMDGYVRRFGGGFAEAYTKRLSETSRLRLKNALFVEHTKQQTIGSIRNERHTFQEATPEPNSFILNQQNVITSSIVIRDANKMQVFFAGLDYEVIQFGNQTEIHRQNGSAIPDVVVVDYQSEPTPAGGYDTVTEAAEIRFELWKHLLAVYGRLTLSLNDAPTELRIQDVEAYTVGSELSWRALRVGGEYELYYSTESNYKAARLFQSIGWHPSGASTLSVDATETWIDYLDSHRQEDDYRLVTRYHDMITPRLSLGVDAGVALRRGNGVDELLAALRPTLKYTIGKTTIDVSYDFEYDLFLENQERQTHRFTFRLKRIF